MARSAHPRLVRHSMSRGLLLRLATCGDPYAIAARGLGTIQRAIRGDQHVLVLRLRPVLGDTDARRHDARRVTHLHTRFLDRRAHLLRHAARSLFPGPYQYHNELVAAIPARQIGPPDVRVAPACRLAQHRVPRLMPELVIHLLEVVEIEKQDRKVVAAAMA